MKHLLTLSFVLLVNVLFSQTLGHVINPKVEQPDSGGPDYVAISHDAQNSSLQIDNYGSAKTILVARITNISTGESNLFCQNTIIHGYHSLYFELFGYQPGIYDVSVVTIPLGHNRPRSTNIKITKLRIFL